MLRVAEHLLARGHQPLVIAPEPNTGAPAAADPAGYPVLRVPSVSLPGYRAVRLGLGGGPGTAQIRGWLADHRTDLVHLASPFILGARGGKAARRLGLPAVAVYQTDVPGYARAYHYGRTAEALAWRWVRRIHNGAARTLAPSTVSVQRLREHGVELVWMWAVAWTASGSARRPGMRNCGAGWRPPGRPSSATWDAWPTRSRWTCWPR